jgi:hypothetical protein
LFYILVTRSLIDKDEKSYNRLCEVLNRARRAQLIAMDAFRDDGFMSADAPGWTSADSLVESLANAVDDFTLDRQQGQDERLIVWCEAQGMVPQLQRVTNEFSVPVFSSGGFDSVTAKHSVARAISDQGDCVTVLHIGDHDPSGVHMFKSLDEDIKAFTDHYNGNISFTRLAVTPDQIARYSLPTAPAKATDNRSFEGETTQAEALDPATLADIVKDAIDSRQVKSVRLAVIQQEQAARESLRSRFDLIDG